LHKKWVLHAWLTDETDQVAFDPTWGIQFEKDGIVFPLPATYIGITLETEKVINFVLATGYKSLIANGWRNLDLADDAIPQFPFKKHIR